MFVPITQTPSQLRLRSVCDLLAESFVVPSYQRGYRWTAHEVEALLNDLAAFHGSSGAGGGKGYYCLQPVVVHRLADGRVELVDGQQRLTTIRLILGALAPVAEMLGKRPYAIDYETRPGSTSFLVQPTKRLAATNVDFHHM
jgi:uncharacterized protein with ParB-like and HNH nuclease domain